MVVIYVGRNVAVRKNWLQTFQIKLVSL